MKKSGSDVRCITLPAGTFYNGDCISGAARYIPDCSVDLIITDPPYGICGDTLHKHYNRNEEFVVDGYVEIPEEEYGKFSQLWIREAERILKPGGSIYIISGYTNLYHILAALKTTGLTEVNHIVWKYSFGVFTRRKFVSSHYHILFYEKPGGTRTFNLESRYGLDEKNGDGGSLNNIDREDVWLINREYKPGMVKNKNELPTELLIKLIQYSSNEGDLVCDLFLGGFSTVIAAIGLNRRATGFEISPAMFDTRIREIEGIVPGSFIPPRTETFPPSHGRISEKHGPRKTYGTWSGSLRGAGPVARQKKISIAALGDKLGRGRWAIIKALTKFANNGKQ